jgi:N-acetylneuraminate synthase
MNRPHFIAEVSSNHHRDIDRCFQFIDASKNIGCQSVKFQLFRIQELFSPEVLAKRSELRRRSEWELPVSFLSELSAYTHSKGLQFSCTPFYLEAVAELEPYVDFYKIASYELLWSDLLRACAQTGKPIVLSTGMATIDEIAIAVKTLRDAGCSNLTLLQCISGYPTPIEQCNLKAIETLRDQFKCDVGWSDHSVSAQVVQRAVEHWGATVIEFHLDLDGEGDEFKTGHCWLPNQMKDVIDSIDKSTSAADWILADGDGVKKPSQVEIEDREWRADPSDGLRPLLATRIKFRD